MKSIIMLSGQSSDYSLSETTPLKKSNVFRSKTASLGNIKYFFVGVLELRTMKVSN